MRATGNAGAIDSAGRIVVVGHSVPSFAHPGNAFVARLTPTGDLDTGFGTNGVVEFTSTSLSTATSVAIDGDRIVVGGHILLAAGLTSRSSPAS